MHNIDWDDVRYFLEVVRSGTITQAATRLGVSHTTVSRRITSLEKQLDRHLFERSNQGWVITPAAEQLVIFAQRMSEDVNSIERQILADNHELSGRLRVTAADHCMERLIMPTAHKFIQQYPKINLELIATADEVDLSTREADIALRGTNTPPPNLVGKYIARLGFAIYGTKKLMTKVESNPNAQDISCITWVGDGHSLPTWIEKNFPQTQRIYRATSGSTMLAMAREGLGIACIACVLGEPDEKLHRIASEYSETGPELWVLSHVDLRTTARVRIFRDFLVNELEAQKDLIEDIC